MNSLFRRPSERTRRTQQRAVCSSVGIGICILSLLCRQVDPRRSREEGKESELNRGEEMGFVRWGSCFCFVR